MFLYKKFLQRFQSLKVLLYLKNWYETVRIGKKNSITKKMIKSIIFRKS